MKQMVQLQQCKGLLTAKMNIAKGTELLTISFVNFNVNLNEKKEKRYRVPPEYSYSEFA